MKVKRATATAAKRNGSRRVLHVVMSLSLIAGVLTVLPMQAAVAATNTLTLDVISARDEPRAFGGTGVSQGDSVPDFKYIINVDNTGSTEQRSPAAGTGCSAGDPGYPGSCNWSSIRETPAPSPIYTQGTQDDFPMTLPDGRYLISVLADGYHIDGAHFTVPLPDPGLVEVQLQPNPLPDSIVRGQVFSDSSTTNGTWDASEAGLAGFVGHLNDVLGEIQTDVYGNPLCTEYEGEDPVTHEIPFGSLDGDMVPVPIDGTGGNCVSDADGLLTIPHMGPNRYAFSATPPDGQTWIQTTTLEGNHDFDAWVMPGATGFDTEFTLAGEPTPQPIFGFAPPRNIMTAGSGHITGVVVGIKTYTPPKGGSFDFWGGNTGTKLDAPIVRPWLSLADLQAGDNAVYIARGNVDGSFDIAGVPDGNYQLSWWDEPQNYNLNLINVTVTNGETVAMGNLPLNGWWTKYDGYVFNDLNRNGVKNPGEPGMPNFTLTMRRQDNSLLDRGQTTVSTDPNGHYFFESAYPLGAWTVMENYNDSFYTTGITYQADNQPTPTTVKGAGVDVSVLSIIGLSGRMDWGVHAYDATGANGIDPRNGGIVGTVSYGTTRNELDPQYLAAEDWQAGVSDVPVELYEPVACGTTPGRACDPTDTYELTEEGAYAQGRLVNTYVTEHWSRPTGCVARDVDGNPLVHGVDENVLVPNQGTDGECISSFLQSVQFGPYPSDQGTPDANFGAAVDGNYGFGDGCTGTLDATDPADPICNGGTFEPLGAGDYLVHIAVPDDASSNPMYEVTGEEDINIANGDQIIPQVPPPACAGSLHTVDVANDDSGNDNYAPVVGDGGVTNDVPVGVIVPASEPVDNATFLDIGGSPFEGLPKPLCDTKLVPLNNGKSIVPIFEVFTNVPIPSHLSGLMVDDINFSTDPRSTMFGEKAGVPFAPIGIYDFNNKLIDTLESDFNGVYDVLLPSTNHISCPTPSGVCANMYRFVANDPGVPGSLNPNFNPRFRTIATEFEALPGLNIPTDLAPTQVGVTVESPATGFTQGIACALDSATPQLFAVSQPYVNGSGSFTINGLGFGATQGAGQVTLDDTIVLPTTSWNDQQIAVTVPATTPAGPHQLKVKANNGQSTVNGLTFHVLRTVLGAFPSGGVLDNFNGRTTMGGNWATTGTGFTVLNPTGTANDYLQVRTADNAFATARWTSGASFNTNQDAFMTLRQRSSAATADHQALMLKWSGSNTPTAGTAQWIEVAVDNSPANSVNVYTKTAGSATITLRTPTAIATPAFNAGDILGARALADGTINVYRNGALVGSVNVPVTAGWSGDIGIRFEGTGTGSPVTAQSWVDDFGGGNVAVLAGSYGPNVYEVGPGKPFATIQAALDAAYNSTGDDLVVVYPGQPDLVNPRNNPRGAYYENLIVASPVKLQGVGPGGFRGNTFVPGSIIDAGAFGGDTALATAWYEKLGTLTWDGNQDVNDGEAIYVLASQNATTANGDARQFTSTFKAGIDGFDIRGGDQQGFPGNVNDLTGGPTGLPPNITTQGGAIFANAYARYLQITNNVVQNNGGGYGTIRIGTPDLAAPDTNQHNEDVRIANNRIISNAGTNLAGGIGLFAGSDRYEVTRNDICGNFSLEYGGGLSVYGLSPNGKIHHNRVYFNQSNDEGGGIMIAGHLPATPGALSPGSGPVDIYNNQIQANLANDDGGGLRFLMAGNFPMNVYNNMIVNNVSTHEGGGVALNDAPNVRVYNNTIMKNLTTATAVTSDGQPVPAGLSTSANSDELQATLPGGSPNYSNPLLFNNIFWDNRAGTRAGTTVSGIGLAGDPNPIDHWDLGVAQGTPAQLLAPTNSVVQQNAGDHNYTTSPSNSSANPAVVSEWDLSVSFSIWRQNPAFVDSTLVSLEAPPNLLGNYHLGACPGSPACNLGAPSKTAPSWQPPSPVAAPGVDFDDQARPAGGGFDSGADEVSGGTTPPPPTSQLYFSTLGNINPPTVTGTADDADIYFWNGTAFSRSIDVTTIGVPTGANVDGFDRVSPTQFYMSFDGSVTLPGAGSVQDEDIVLRNGSTWSLYFDGSANGLTGTAGTDLDAISIVGAGGPGNVYFSTDNTAVPPGAGGTGDDSDIYRWTGGSSYSRVADATVLGWSPSNVDGLVWVDATHVYLSYSANATPPSIAQVQDEDVVYNNGGTWSVYFDGTAAGLTDPDHDVDAFDVP